MKEEPYAAFAVRLLVIVEFALAPRAINSAPACGPVAALAPKR